jgi:hypothetical protein
MSEPVDLSSIPETTIEEMHRQAEACLAGTIQLALAADARATTLTGILGGGAVALLAAGASIVASGSYDKFHAVLWSALVVAVAWFFGAMSCAWSGRPTEFYIGGYEPRRLAKSATDRVWVLRYATEDLQKRIDANRKTLDHNAKYLRCGLLSALLGVVAGVGLFFIA